VSVGAAAERVAPNGRVLGTYDTGRAGPVVVAIAGMHGNEPGGLAASHAVLHRLGRDRLPLKGSFTAVAGNLTALERGRRYVTRDLNRMWSAEAVERLRAADPSRDDSEQVEQRALLELFDDLVRAHGEVVFLDLHSTSGPSAPFHCISDTLHSRAIALATPIPLILGIEEAIHGSLLEFMEERGRPLILVEAGQHVAEQTWRRHEAAVWRALVTVGSLAPDDVPELATHDAELRSAARGLPSVVEITYRHAIEPGGGFVMRPGFRNFQQVKRGDMLAEDHRGGIAAPQSGLLLMPLYQAEGEDGFFIGRPIRRSWLRVSTLMRYLQMDHLLPHLPGVRRDPLRPTRLLVDPHIARWFTVHLFHLCGFRRLADRGQALVFTRRVE